MDEDFLRRHVLELLRGGHAHATHEQALADFPVDRVNDRPPGVPYSAWQVLEHMRIAQRDILDFTRDPSYREPRWPDDYWPPEDETADERRWQESLEGFRRDYQAVLDLAADPATDYAHAIPWGNGQTMLREFLLVADHNAYHVGELVLLRRALGIWKS